MTSNKRPDDLYDYKKTEAYRYHRRVLDEFRALPVKERLQSLIDVGILTPELKLTERYVGDPAPDQTSAEPHPPKGE